MCRRRRWGRRGPGRGHCTQSPGSLAKGMGHRRPWMHVLFSLDAKRGMPTQDICAGPRKPVLVPLSGLLASRQRRRRHEAHDRPALLPGDCPREGAQRELAPGPAGPHPDRLVRGALRPRQPPARPLRREAEDQGALGRQPPGRQAHRRGNLGEPQCGSLRPAQCRTGMLPTSKVRLHVRATLCQSGLWCWRTSAIRRRGSRAQMGPPEAAHQGPLLPAGSLSRVRRVCIASARRDRDPGVSVPGLAPPANRPRPRWNDLEIGNPSIVQGWKMHAPMRCEKIWEPAVADEGTQLSSARDAGSRDTWQLVVSRQAAEGRTETTVDTRMAYRGTRADGELKLSFQADSDGQYVLLCGAPCSWWCNGNAGFVSSKSQRWWPKDGPERKNVSDLTFSIDGRDISGGELTRLHDEMFHQETGKFCPGCKNPMDLCQPVAKVAKGRHTVGARVEPRTRAAIAPADVPHMQEGEEMFVEILEMLVVG
ncbi:unnamed protein product [Prorocentrum cordatum]|uniref:DUF1080 domain-containing protein n=1 Tax=Prorocentrum cordatum TaxID=2364126 RepID=A0ABN9SDH7_9DINO|nr:unnamed protein product [Polarella glacialis]